MVYNLSAASVPTKDGSLMLLPATGLPTTLTSLPLHILTEPTNAWFYYYLFHFKLSPTCISLTALNRELTPTHVGVN
jgi:hypothetical protein